MKEKLTKKNIKKNFNMYSSHKRDELTLDIDGKFVPARYIMVRDDSLTKPAEDWRIIISNKLIERFNPNKIDNSYFWKCATKTFPLISIGDNPPYLPNLGTGTLNGLHKPSGALGVLSALINNNPNSKILEIGPGFGCIKNYIDEKYNIKNYYAIDICPHFKFERLYKCDGKNIPIEIPNPFDIVYSINVFQHLTREQKSSYYKQVDIILRPGGEFIFGTYVATKETLMTTFNNGKSFLFGMIDENGNPYCQFFNQFTPVDFLEDIELEFETLDMEIVEKIIKGNHGVFRAIKR